jgi:anti-sigma regulatory factor (Ser/Thr protein kinase)
METIARIPLPYDEFRIWETHLRPRCAAAGVDEVGMNILSYACTEVLNNALDHSGSPEVVIGFAASQNALVIHVQDTGVGVFARVAEALGLESLSDAVIELTKGKTTSDPARHTGQGLFFSSRACDWFCVEANGYALSWENGEGPAALKFNIDATQSGSLVKLRLGLHPKRTLRSVFDTYCPQPELEFSRTAIQLRLLSITQGGLISRSQAKRVVNGLHRFESVTFDFTDVAEMQQGFADEIFRVWHRAFPQVKISVTNANEQCGWMLKHVGFEK